MRSSRSLSALHFSTGLIWLVFVLTLDHFTTRGGPVGTCRWVDRPSLGGQAHQAQLKFGVCWAKMRAWKTFLLYEDASWQALPSVPEATGETSH